MHVSVVYAASPNSVLMQQREATATSFQQCQTACGGLHQCCNTRLNPSSNQQLSCLQACMLRVRGSSRQTCESQCRDGFACDALVHGHLYETCGHCQDHPSRKFCGGDCNTITFCPNERGSSEQTCLSGCMLGSPAPSPPLLPDPPKPSLAPLPPNTPPAPSSPPPQRLRVLIVDGHSGPLNDAHAFLTRLLDAQVDSVSYMLYSSYAKVEQAGLLPSHVRQCLGRFLSACSYQTGSKMRACIDALKPRSDYRREFVELFGPTIERNFDVVLCQFPGWQCALFQELRVGLAVRFTHRFDHHIWYGGMDAKAEWDKLLVQWHTRMAHTAIFADNPYDAQYLWHYLRVPAISWPAVGLKLISDGTPTLTGNKRSNKFRHNKLRSSKVRNKQWCWCCFGSLPDHGGTNQLVRHLEELVPESSIGVMKKLRVDPDAESLAQTTNCTAFILIPHSLHSYASVEVYAVGYPMIVPSAALLAEWHDKYEVVQHRAPGNRPWMPSLQAATDSPLSPHKADMERWLTHVDFLSWPHVKILHRNADLRHLMAHTPHTLQPQQPRYMRMASLEALPRIESSLRDVVRGAHEGRMRDDSPPPWNATRALVQLATVCQANNARVRPALRSDLNAAKAWAALQRGSLDVEGICKMDRRSQTVSLPTVVSRFTNLTSNFTSNFTYVQGRVPVSNDWCKSHLK